MSLFKRRRGSDKKKEKKPVEPAEPKAPKLSARAGEVRSGEIKEKVQGEVCAILARTILELIQSSQARTPSMEELVRRQSINRLYADVLYDFLSSGAQPSYDPADEVLAWAREAIDTWGGDQKAVDEDIAKDKSALADSILAALEIAARDGTLRKAAEQRIKAESKAPAVD